MSKHLESTFDTLVLQEGDGGLRLEAPGGYSFLLYDREPAGDGQFS